MNNVVNPYEPINTPAGAPAPLVLTLITHPLRHEYAGGVLESSAKVEQYIILSALPEELRQRVVTAIQALQASL